MSRLQLTCYRSVQQLRAASGPWDDLWARSEASPPTVQAELVADWIEQFAPRARVRCLAVEQAGRLVAALPLAERPLLGRGLAGKALGGWPAAGALTNNPWNMCGDLLWDPASGEAALERLAEGIAELPWSLVWMEGAPLESERWRLLAAALGQSGLSYMRQADCRIGQVEIAGDFASFSQGWSKNHRQKMKKVVSKLEREGAATLRSRRDVASRELSALLQEAFAVEDKSWKGAEGTSVFKTPGALDYFTRVARRLAERGQLEIHFLDQGGRPISFSFGYRVRGVYYMHKVGYDEAFARFSPTNILVLRLLEREFASGDLSAIDFFGPLQDWTSKWSTRSYSVGRLVAAPRGLLGRCYSGSGLSGRGLLWAYRDLWPRWKSLRARLQPPPPAEQPATGPSDSPPAISARPSGEPTDSPPPSEAQPGALAEQPVPAGCE